MSMTAKLAAWIRPRELAASKSRGPYAFKAVGIVGPMPNQNKSENFLQITILSKLIR